MKNFLLFTALILLNAACKKKCDDFSLDNEYNKVCDLLAADELDIYCDETLSYEGEEIGIVGKLNPDFADYLNEYDADFPDTWPSSFRIIDSSLDENDRLTTNDVINNKTVQINLAHDGVNPESFEPLKEQLETLFAGKAFSTIRVKGIARGVDMPTNATCDKGVIFEIDGIEDVEIE